MAHLSRISHEVAIRCRLGIRSSEALGQESPHPAWLTHMKAQVVLVVDWRCQFFSIRASSQGCLSVLEAWQLVTSRKSNLRGLRGSCNTFHDLAFKVTHHYFPCIVLIKSQGRTSHLLIKEGQHHVVKENVRWDGHCIFGKYNLPKCLTLVKRSAAKKHASFCR